MSLSRETVEAAKSIASLLLQGAGAGISALRMAKAAKAAKAAKGGGALSGALSKAEAKAELAPDMVDVPNGFDAGVIFVPGPPQHNAMFVRTPDNLNSFIHQTPAEHKAALEKFLSDSRIPPEKAVRLGRKEEANLPKWWDDDSPRKPVTPSSSAVSSARIGEDGNIYVIFGGRGKEYTYRGSSDPVKASKILAELVTAPSIGRAACTYWGKKYSIK